MRWPPCAGTGTGSGFRPVSSRVATVRRAKASVCNQATIDGAAIKGERGLFPEEVLFRPTESSPALNVARSPNIRRYHKLAPIHCGEMLADNQSEQIGEEEERTMRSTLSPLVGISIARAPWAVPRRHGAGQVLTGPRAFSDFVFGPSRVSDPGGRSAPRPGRDPAGRVVASPAGGLARNPGSAPGQAQARAGTGPRRMLDLVPGSPRESKCRARNGKICHRQEKIGGGR